MVTIEIKYRPIEFFPWERHKNIMLPTEWDELTEKQFIFASDLQLRKHPESKMLQIFLRVNRVLARRIISLQRYSILKHLVFLQKPEPIDYFKIKKLLNLNAPKPRLENVSLKAFIIGDAYYQKYIGVEKDDLNRFIAHFFTDGTEFDETLINIHLKLIRRTDIKTREAIALNYGMIREWLYVTYPYAFRLIEKVKKILRSDSLVDAFEYMYTQDGLLVYDTILNIPISEVLKELEYTGKLHFTNKAYNPFHTGMFLDPAEVKFPDVKILNPNAIMTKDGKFLDPHEN